MSYRIFTDATADMSSEMLKDIPHIEIIPMEVIVGDETYTYGPLGNLTVGEFYRMQRDGKFAQTSQISPETYRAAFEPYLKAGKDVLYLGFSSGMSGTMNSAFLCAKELEEEYPERKIVCIDTLCGSVGEGFLVYEAAKKQEAGMSFDELVDWVNECCLNVCHWFTVDTFEHLLHGGRVSSVAATMGAVLNIKPMLYVDEEGKLKTAEKPRGNKQAIKAKLSHMQETWAPEMGNFVLVGHADNPEGGVMLRDEVVAKFPQADVKIADIGPVIGAHVGPGMTALIFWGTKR